MTEIIWVYDRKKAEERNRHLSDLMKDTLLEKTDIKDSSEVQKWREDHEEILEKIREKREERIKSYDGGTIIASKSFNVDEGFNEEKDVHTFTAVLKNGKIGIFRDDGFYPENIYCHYLRNDNELNLFFDSIRVISYPIDGQYRRGSKTGYAESTDVYFDIEERINDIPITIGFSDGSWSSSSTDNEEKYPNWDLDELESDRDDIIKEIKDYIEKENI